MALVFAIAIIATYIALCVTSVAGLQRMSLIERRQRETAYDPAFRTRRHLRAPVTHFDNRGVHEIADLNVVKDACTNLQQMMAAAFSSVQRICCFFTNRRLMIWLMADSTNAVEIASPLRQRIAVVRDERAIRVDVTAELPQHALELGPIFALVRQRRDVAGEVVNDGQGAPHIPVPEIPLQAFKIAEKLQSSERLIVGVAIASRLHRASGVAHAECELMHHREPQLRRPYARTRA